MTLTEFLLARIAEDEQVARAIALDPDGVARQRFGKSGVMQWFALAIDRPWRDGASRVLAECEAKRAAIDAAWDDHERIESEWGSCQSREQMSAKDDNPAVVQHLALPYADHPDYREEWRP